MDKNVLTPKQRQIGERTLNNIERIVFGYQLQLNRDNETIKLGYDLFVLARQWNTTAHQIFMKMDDLVEYTSLSYGELVERFKAGEKPDFDGSKTQYQAVYKNSDGEIIEGDGICGEPLSANELEGCIWYAKTEGYTVTFEVI